MKLNNKGFGVIAILLVLVGILAVGGGAYYLKKSSKNIPPVSVEENNLVEENQNDITNSDVSTQNPLSDEEINSKIKINLESFLATEDYKPTTPGNISSCSSILYGHEDSYAYAWVFCGEYDKNFKLTTASSLPMRVEYNSALGIVSVYEAPDGEGNFEKSKKIFGKFYDVLAKGPSNQERLTLSQEALNKAKAFTNNIKKDCLPTTTPWIKVLSPNGGENYNIGGKITVKWDSCNVPSSSYDIFVALHQNGEWQNVAYLSNSTINDGSETFTIPTVTLGNYKVRVGSASATVKQDWSDKSFTINSSTTTNLRKDGETCGENIGNCEVGLKCGYPCGIPGCQYVCMPENTPPVP